MVKKLTFIGLIILSATAFGQKTSFRVSLNSGLFSFSGKSAAAVSFITYNSSVNKGYTNNPYGSKPGPCYGISASIHQVSKKGLVVGADLGYEKLNSKISIDEVGDYNGITAVAYDATGKTLLGYDFINIFPFIGKQFRAGKIYIGLTGGIELGYCLSANEKGNATASNGIKYLTDLDRKTIKTDVRPRIQLSADYGRIGMMVGYSYGLTNYKSGYLGGINECYARIVRVGLSWQLNK